MNQPHPATPDMPNTIPTAIPSAQPSHPQLKQISVISGNTYAVTFDDHGTDLTIECTVHTEGKRPHTTASQTRLFATGYLGDPRPVMAAVTAFHRARHGDLSTWNATPGPSASPPQQ